MKKNYSNNKDKFILIKSLKYQYLIYSIISICMFGEVFCQETSKATQPLELPNFIIEGKEQINVRAGIKQMPEKSSALNQTDLDSLNSLEKQQSLLLPPKSFPDQILSYKYDRGYLSAEFGRFTTPSIIGG